MAVICSLTKKGILLKREVDETVDQIWDQMNFQCGDNSTERPLFNRDFLLLTQGDKHVIIHKRFINFIDDTTT